MLPLFWHLHAQTFRHSSFLRQGRKTMTKGPVSFAADWLLQNINTLLPMKPRGRISWWTTLYRLGGYQLGRMHKPCLHGYSRRDDRIRLRKIMHLIIISIYQISKWQFSLVLIGSRNSECPWLFTVLRPEPRWRLVSRQFRKTNKRSSHYRNAPIKKRRRWKVGYPLGFASKNEVSKTTVVFGLLWTS